MPSWVEEEDDDDDEDEDEDGEAGFSLFMAEVVWMAGIVETDVKVDVYDLPLESVDTILERTVVAEAGSVMVTKPLEDWLGIGMAPTTVGV